MKAGSDKAKFNSFSNYTKSILRSSLITSLPEIALAKTWQQKVVKICVFLACLFGFVYQTYNFLYLYLSYPTTVNVQVSNPFEIEQPALTFCNKNRQRRTVICEGENNQCSFLPETQVCEQFPRYCKTKNMFRGVPFLNTVMEDKFYWNRTAKEAHTTRMILQCAKVIEGVRYKCKKPYLRVPMVTIESKPNYCYTVESQWMQPDSVDEIYPNTFYYEITLLTEPEEYTVYSDPIQIYAAIHDRRRIINPYTEGFVLKGGIQYQAYVSMTAEKSLPYPYSTNCTDYIKLWRENNGTGPLNQLMCIENCKLSTLLSLGKCIDDHVAYPHEYPLCRRGEITATSEIIEGCTKQCGAPCKDQRYQVQYDEVTKFEHLCQPSNENCKFARIVLTVSFQRFQVTNFIYQAKFESVEMFSYVGGYMGMWLGLSLVSLFDLFETFMYLLYFPMGRKKAKAKKMTPINPFKKTILY